MTFLKKIRRKWIDLIDNLNNTRPFLGFMVHFISLSIFFIICLSLISFFIIDLTTVKGRSMEPTLYENNRLIVLKSHIKIQNLFGQYVPKRGEVIIFKTKNPINNKDHLLVKRVIGLPGEKIQISSGVLTIYNQKYPNGFTPSTSTSIPDLQQLPVNEEFNMQIQNDEVFVLGDNFLNSQDSRTIGNIPLDSIESVLILRLWPFNQFQFF